MAHKYETDQQFMESIVRQVAKSKIVEDTQTIRGSLRPTANQSYHGSSFYPTLDEEEPLFPNNQSHLMRNTQDDPSGHDWDDENKDWSVDSNPIIPQRNAEAKMIGTRKNSGGYSSDIGRHENPRSPDVSSLEEHPRIEMKKVKRSIQELERQLHELQEKKVKLMRKITGRLEENKFEDNVAFFKNWLG